MRMLKVLMAACPVRGLAWGLAWVLAVHADGAPESIRYQARLVEPGGPANGARVVAFRLYEAETGGTPAYTETQTVIVTNGLYDTVIGASDALPGALSAALAHDEVWLEVAINGTTLAPRERIVAVAYALSAGGVRAGGVTTAMLVDDAVTSTRIADAQVSGADIATDAVQTAHIVDNAVTADKIFRDEISAHTPGLITEGVADGAITSTRMADGAVGSHHIPAASIGGAWFAAGAVDGVDIAAGAVGSQHIAGNGIGSLQVADGTIQSLDIAPGAVGGSALARAYQSGTADLSGLAPSGTFAQRARYDFGVTFPDPFPMTPVVTMGVETPSAEAGWGTRAHLQSRSPAQFTAYVSMPLVGLTVDVDVIADFPGSGTSLAVVNGRPAIAYFDAGQSELRFVRANDGNGSSWGTPVIADSVGVVGWFPSLAIVNGRPAISYYAPLTGDLRYVRANDATGATWGTPRQVHNTGDVGYYTALAVVNGRPMICYGDKTNGRLRYSRSSDVDGTSWGITVGTIDSSGDVAGYVSLKILPGRPGPPAVAYYAGGELRYARALDVNGVSWATPTSLTEGGQFASLEIVNGRPAISYYKSGPDFDLKYIRALDAFGLSWDSPATLDYDGVVGYYTSLAVVNGRPAVTYYDDHDDALMFVKSKDVYGISWGKPMTLDRGGTRTSLAFINGEPAVSYLDAATEVLKYMRAGTPGTDSVITWIAIEP